MGTDDVAMDTDDVAMDSVHGVGGNGSASVPVPTATSNKRIIRIYYVTTWAMGLSNHRHGL